MTCPCCGYCSHCGRGGSYARPYYPFYPQPWYQNSGGFQDYQSSGNISLGGQHSQFNDHKTDLQSFIQLQQNQ